MLRRTVSACELEELLDERGREVLRQLLQDHYDLRRAREGQRAGEQRVPVTGADGITRPRLEAGHAVRHGAGHPVRLAEARSGQLVPGRRGSVPAGRAALPLPGELAAIETARGSFDDAQPDRCRTGQPPLGR